MTRITNDLGLTGLVEGVFNAPGQYGQSEVISQPYTFSEGIQYTPFTLNRIALNYGYMALGLVQALINLPVEDAFRGGVEIETDELDEEDIKLLQKYMEENGDLESIEEARIWARLFGGGGLLIETEDDDTKKPLQPKKLKPDSVLRFVPADRWELTLTTSEIMDTNRVGFHHGNMGVRQNDVPYLYYTVQLHKSRVMRVMGRKAPSYVRQRLQGWGMSELERCMRSINSFIKLQNVIFELVDEAKIDVFGIQGFNEAMASQMGVDKIQRRIALNALLKNYKNSTVMDKEDTFDSKTMSYGGLADIYVQSRINVCADIGMPEAKLFGQSASGFSSGDDVIENYNILVEGERKKSKPLLHGVIDLRAQQLFGFVPEYETKFKPLRVLSEPEEEAVLTSRQNRALGLFDRQLFTAQEVMESMDKDKLVNIPTEVQQGLRDVAQAMPGEDSEDEGRDKKENSINKLLAKRANTDYRQFIQRDAAIMKHFKGTNK
jgi:phage-related protein (TIGR01555 family)